MKAKTYEVSGLHVRSEIPLGCEVADATAVGGVDFVVTAGECRPIPWERPSPEVIAEAFDGEGWPRYSFCALDDERTVARFYAFADFVLDVERRHAVCHRDPGITDEIAGLLVPGNILSYLLSVAGECVLHASAVEFSPGQAVAFVGPTTRGKTTCATLLCAEGCPLITDDVLVLDLSEGAPRCRRGATTLRLRPQQAPLVSRFARAPIVTDTPDGRLAVRPRDLAVDGLALSAIVTPVASRLDNSFRHKRLSTTEALSLILAMPRIEGWRSAAHLSRMFAQAATVAEAVPVVEMNVPWGPPFGSDVGARLIGHIEAVASTR